MKSRDITLRAVHDLRQISEGQDLQEWEIIGTDPQFIVDGFGVTKPGFYRLDLRLPKEKMGRLPHDATIYYDLGGGFDQTHTTPLTFQRTPEGATAGFVLPGKTYAIRFDPTTKPGVFSIAGARLTQYSGYGRRMQQLRAAARLRVRRPGDLIKLSAKSIRILSNGGIPALRANIIRALRDKTEENYAAWVKLYDTLDDGRLIQLQDEVKALENQPLISILMPIYNTPSQILIEAIESVLRQVYPNWELCIADDASTEPGVRRILENYKQRDDRIKIVMREENGHISHATNSAMEIASGEWVALLDHDDILRENALAEVALEIDRHPAAQLIYSDEDKIDSAGERYDAYFKPDFSLELFRSQNYLNHLTVHRAENIRKVGGWRPGFEGSQDYDLNFRIIEQIDEKSIHHIPQILYHWRAVAGSTASAGSEKSYARKAALKALKEHMERLELDATAEEIPGLPFYRLRHHVPEPQPLVSLIIPTRDGLDFLKNCIASIREKTTYRNYEIIVVDNGSKEKATHAYFREIAKHDNVRVLGYDKPFNYSAINNFAVRSVRGSVIGLINNDIEVIAPDWLTEMVSYALQPDIGCVGAKLRYADGLLQHAGVIVGLGGVAGHSHKHFPADHPGDHYRLQLVQNLSAVTAACLIVRREVFLEVGGLNENDLAIAFNDVDFCLRVREAGYKNVWTPFAELYHLESVSRGAEDNPEKVERFNREVSYMKDTWSELLEIDPYYSPNLTVAREDFSLAFPPRLRR